MELVDATGKIVYSAVVEKYPWIIAKNQKCILSPDSDGLLCGLLMQHLFNWEIVGLYDGKVMALQEGLKAKDCIFLDMEIFRNFTKSLGQHMLMWDSKKDPLRPQWQNFINCISPNNIRKIDGKRAFKRKYPLGTIHLLLGIIGSVKNISISNDAICPLLYTDGTFKNMFNYPENTLDWLEFLCAENSNSPLYKVFFNNNYTTFNLMSALKDFFAKIKELGGDKIKISNKNGEFENFEQDGRVYSLSDEQINIAHNFLKFLASLMGWNLNWNNWKFKNMKLYKFQKGTIKPNGRNFDELMSKNPVSWAMTSTLAIEYTVEEDNFR